MSEVIVPNQAQASVILPTNEVVSQTVLLVVNQVTVGGIGTGDVTGPASSVADRISVFNGTTGKIIKDGGKTVAEVLNTDNHTNGTTNKVYTATEKTKLAGIESGADVTDAANVDAAGAVMNTDTTTAEMQFVIDEDSFASDLATKVPTQQSTKAYIATREAAIKAYADALVVGLLDDRGNYDASGNVFPSSGGSGTSGAILKGDIWTISVAGTLGGTAVTAGDLVRALVDTPGQTAANWAVSEANIGYVAENQSNKDTDSTFAANSDTKYPSQKAVKTALAAKQDSLGYTAENTSNKSTNVVTDQASNTKYPSVKAVYDWAVGAFQALSSALTDLASRWTPASSSGPASLQFHEDTDNGTNKVTLIGPASLAADRTITLPDATDTLVGKATTDTLTNKRITARVQSVTSSATVTPDADADDEVKITAQAAGLTLANPTGTPTEGQSLIIRIKDNGTARAISFGTKYRAFGSALPTTTTISKTMYLGMIYNATDDKWDVFPYQQEQ